jgi:phage repressor protein C with HTH and peptisase S24 domain
MDHDRLDKRIREAMGDHSARSIARKAGISDSTLRSILSGSRPTVDNLVALARALGVSIEWLATGSEPGRTHLSTSASIPFYEALDALVAASPPSDAIELPAEFVRNHLGCGEGRLAATEVVGDAMAPTLCQGDLALVDLSIDSIARDDIYVLTFEGTIHLNRVQRSGSALIVLADNPVYRAWTIEATRTPGVRVAGRVVGTIRHA